MEPPGCTVHVQLLYSCEAMQEKAQLQTKDHKEEKQNARLDRFLLTRVVLKTLTLSMMTPLLYEGTRMQKSLGLLLHVIILLCSNTFLNQLLHCH